MTIDTSEKEYAEDNKHFFYKKILDKNSSNIAKNKNNLRTMRGSVYISQKEI